MRRARALRAASPVLTRHRAAVRDPVSEALSAVGCVCVVLTGARAVHVSCGWSTLLCWSMRLAIRVCFHLECRANSLTFCTWILFSAFAACVTRNRWSLPQAIVFYLKNTTRLNRRKRTLDLCTHSIETKSPVSLPNGHVGLK